MERDEGERGDRSCDGGASPGISAGREALREGASAETPHLRRSRPHAQLRRKQSRESAKVTSSDQPCPHVRKSWTGSSDREACEA